MNPDRPCRPDFETRRAAASPPLAFTLVELQDATAIFAILLAVLVSLSGVVSQAWTYTSSRADQFREARNGFETMTRVLSQATLNTYMDYVSVAGSTVTYRSSTGGNAETFVPNAYARASELRFLSGPGLAGNLASSPVRPTHAVFFQAPLGFVSDETDYGGLASLVSTMGFYIEFNSDIAVEPSFITSLHSYSPRYRFRLMEMMEPSEDLSIYKYTSGNPGLISSGANGENWFTDPLHTTPDAHVLAENIVALIISPKLSPGDETYAASLGVTGGDGMLAPAYSYDSTSTGPAQNFTGAAAGIVDTRNQLPPLLQVTMVAVDEPSFKRLQGTTTTAPSLINSSLFLSVGNTDDPSQPGYAADLATLQKNLQALKLTYRVFSTTVAVKAAKWSRGQTN